MRNKKSINKYIFTISIFLSICLFSAAPVSANAPIPGPSIVIYFDGKLSDDIAFVDILAPIASDSVGYTEYNQDSGNDYGINKNSQIVRYHMDGFVSYTFHYQGASSGMTIQGPEHERYYSVRFEMALEHLEEKTDYIKLAFLSSDGDILHITESLQIAGIKTGYFTGSIDIDPKTLEVTAVNYYDNPLMPILYLIIAIPRIIFSVTVEVFIAYFFDILPLRKIVCLNIATQVGLTLFMATTSIAYWPSLILGEIAVYLIEATALMLIFKEHKKSKIIVYVLVANTFTLCFGLLLIHIGLLKY